MQPSWPSTDAAALAPSWLDSPLLQAALSAPALVLVGALVVKLLRPSWELIDQEAAARRPPQPPAEAAGAATPHPRPDARAMTAFVLGGLVLVAIEYAGSRAAFVELFAPLLSSLEERPGWTWLSRFDELQSLAFWVLSRELGFLSPLLLWKALWPRDRWSEWGVRLVRWPFPGLRLYLLCLAVVLPLVLLASRSRDFVDYYPFYDTAGRSWLDWGLWEALYLGQFLALELFFRGWWLHATARALGSVAIFAVAVPYCMIHFGKPYPEVLGALVTGVVLGTLSLRTGSILPGAALHMTVAISMDALALWRRGEIPTRWTPF